MDHEVLLSPLQEALLWTFSYENLIKVSCISIGLFRSWHLIVFGKLRVKKLQAVAMFKY